MASRPHLLAPLLILIAGCNIARIADKQTMTSVAPKVMANPDVGLGCATGEAMAPVLQSLGDGDKQPHKSLVLTYMSAAMCVEPLAWDTELSRMKAARSGQGDHATDLLEVERRQHALAAHRYLAAWGHLGHAFGEPGGAACPSLDSRRNDDLLYVLGLSSGLLALVHDQASGGQVGVSMDVPRQVERAAACLDNRTWWGVPQALRAAVWASVPGAAPDGKDPIALLAESAAMGDAAGVRLARAFQVQTLATTGRSDELRAAVAEHAAARARPGANPDFRMLNAYAHQLIRHESDKVWVRKKGHRTPTPLFGTFPMPPEQSEQSDGLDDLLDSLMPAEPAATAEDETQPAPGDQP